MPIVRTEKEAYVIITGEYSDKQVEAVFTDEEQAELFCRLFVDGRIETYTLNPPNPYLDAIRNDYFFWIVEIASTGDVKNCWQVSVDDEFFGIKNPGEYYIYDDDSEGRLVIKVLAKDYEHAVKIANEKRGQLIASGSWNPR